MLSPGDVLFISAPEGLVNAMYGGLMSTRAQYLGAAGAIVDGRVRDLQEHRDLGFPVRSPPTQVIKLFPSHSSIYAHTHTQVFARGVSTTAGQEVARPSEVNVPVRLNGGTAQPNAWIHPGDYIVADLDGVVCIPQALVQRVLEHASQLVARDEKVKADIRAGRSVQDAFREHRGK
jgi:regulator of RNase E activity RraA